MLTARDLSGLLRSASGLMLVLYFVLRSVPETLLGDVYIGPMPLHFFVFCIGLSFELLYISTSRVELLLSKPVVAILLVYALTLVNGIDQENSLKFMAIDSICIFGMLYGALLAKSRPIAIILKIMQRRILTLVFAIGTISFVGIHVGLIKPAGDSTRLYTYSDFDNMFMLSALSPLACLVPFRGQREKVYYYVARFAPVLLAAALAWSTASRSGFACCIVSATAVFTLLFDGRYRILGVLVMAVSSILFLFTSEEWRNDTQLMSRVSSTSVYDEARYIEVGLLLDDLQGHELIGKGLGSRFATNIDVADHYAFAPHIGLFAIVHKAGFPLFIAVMIAPILMSAYVVFSFLVLQGQRPGFYRVKAGLAWSVIVCAAQMSMSSGWDPLVLSVAALCFIAMTLQHNNSGTCSSKPSKNDLAPKDQAPFQTKPNVNSKRAFAPSFKPSQH